MERFRIPSLPVPFDPRNSIMRLIKSLMNRLSDSVLLSVPNRLMAASGLPVLRLRLVSEKSTALPQAEGTSRRLSTHPGGQLEAIDEAIRKSQAWFLVQTGRVGRVLGRRARSRHHPDFRIPDVTPIHECRGSRAGTKSRELLDVSSAPGGRMADLLWRPLRYQRVGQSLFRIEACAACRLENRL